MLLTLISAMAACQSMAMRPEVGRAADFARFAKLEDLGSKISSPKDGMAALKAASEIVDGILAQTGNATDHMSSDDESLMRQVITLVEDTIFASLDSASEADLASLTTAVDAADLCNIGIEQRLSSTGDLGQLNAATNDKQTELNTLQGVVDDKTTANNSAWASFDTHNQMIDLPPACPVFPAKTKPALDVYFEKSDYVTWYAHQQTEYQAIRATWSAANDALVSAIADYNVGLAVRTTQYCDWKTELEAGCAAFDLCFQQKTDFYTDEESPRVHTDMDARIEVYKSGQDLVHQIKFLLGDVSTQVAPPPDTSRYELTFPVLPAKTTCDLTVLESSTWIPTPECDDTATAP